MKLSKEHLEAITNWLNDNGLSYREAGKVLGISGSSVGDWFRKEAPGIRTKQWEKLKPLIQPYLEPGPPVEVIPERLQPIYKLIEKAHGDKDALWLIEQQVRSVVDLFQKVRAESSPFKQDFLQGPERPGVIAFPEFIKQANYRHLGEEEHQRLTKEQEKAMQSRPPLPLFELTENHHHLQMNAAAGIGLLPEVDYDDHMGVKGFEHDESIIRVKAEGDSMDPIIADGETAVVRKLVTPIILGVDDMEAPKFPINVVRGTVPDNSIALLQNSNGEVTIKRIRYWVENGNDWSLFIHCDNKFWGHENGMDRRGHRLERDEELHLYGIVIGKINPESIVR